jgi:signal transduction histidine kinase
VPDALSCTLQQSPFFRVLVGDDCMSAHPASLLNFLADGGQTGALMRDHDWSLSPLGHPASWPQSLRSIVGMLLNSKFPMFVAWGPALGMLYNDAYIEILGDKHPAALGARLDDIWAEVWDAVRPSIAQAMRGQAVYGENLPLTVSRRGYDEPAWFTFSYSPVRDESGEVGGMFCAVVETTEQVLAQRHRADEITRLQRLFQHAPGIIAILRGPEHIFDIANDGYCRFIGRDDSVGKTVRQALPELEGQGFYALLDQVYASGKPYIGNEVPIMLQREPEGPLEERFASFIYQPTFDHRGDISGIFVEGSDVTESVRALRALQASENALKATNHRKDEFLAMLAHELRNPLAPITNAAELLKMAPLGNDKVMRAAEVIARQARHLRVLVDDLLDVSRVTRGLVDLKMDSVDLHTIVESAVEQARPLMQSKGHALTVRHARAHPSVMGDRNRLVQVMVNLLNNAANTRPTAAASRWPSMTKAIAWWSTWKTTASASTRICCPTCSTCSPRPRARRTAPRADSVSAWRWSRPSSACTAAKSARPAAGRGQAPGSR